MLGEEKTIPQTLKRYQRFRYALVAEGIVVGGLAGAVVVVFRILLEMAAGLLQIILAFGQAHPWFMPVWLGILLMMALVVALLLRWEPYISGSGIPQVEGEMQGELQESWWRVLLAKYLGGIIAIGCGLSLGREGPSIQLGAMTAKGFAQLAGRMRTEEKLLITCGASAGLSAAFNAPIAGVLFSLEEIHKNFSPEVLLSTMAASITADFISQNIFGLQPVFAFDIPTMLPLGQYGHVIALGIILGILGVLYNRCIAFSQTLFQKLPYHVMRLAIPFLLAGVLGFVYPAVLGGGHPLVERISLGDMALSALALLLVVKFMFSMISFGSGAPGGIFLPLLVLGAVIGGMYAGCFPSLAGFLGNFVILGMAGYFTAIVRAPITGIILISEMTGSFSHLLTLSIVALFAYLVPDILGCQPIYSQLLHRLLKDKKEGRMLSSREKILVDGMVFYGATAAGRKVADIVWPESCLLVSIKRGDEEFIPKGSTHIRAGDRITLLCDENAARLAHETLEEKCETVQSEQ